MNVTKILHAQLLRTPSTPLFQLSVPLQPHPQRLSTLSPIRSSSSGQGGKNGESLPPTSPITPPDTVEIRFRRGSRRRQREQNEPNKMTAPPAPKKSWEDMTLSEKAVELYVGEKGALFWLNKFAYASIYIIIGGWILFRFVGPALNLYQLDSAPLAPNAMFKG